MVSSADASGSTTVATLPPATSQKNVRLRLAVEGIRDMMAAMKDTFARYMPEQNIDPEAFVKAGLLQSGFGPGFFENLDLDRLAAFDVAFPPRGGASASVDVLGSVPVKQARKLIESMPAAIRPQPLGGGMWELALDSRLRLVLRESATTLDVARTVNQLDVAASLPASFGAGRRVRLQATDIPVDDVGIASELLGMPDGSGIGKQLDAVVREAKALWVQADFGIGRDAELAASAEAPFHKLGLEPLGAPRTAASRTESLLAKRPVAALTISWGNPSLLHRTLDQQIPADAIPEPYGSLLRKALTHVHALLDQISDDVAIAFYLTPKGEGGVLLAAGVRDEAASKASLRGLNEVISNAVLERNKLVGKNTQAQLKMTWKPDGLTLTKAKADHLSVTLPAELLETTPAAKMMLSGGTKLDSIALVRDRTVFVAIGAAARSVMAQVARRSANPESPGLALARRGVSGCQICFAGDAIGLYRVMMLTNASATKDKALDEAAATLAKPGLSGPFGAGIRLENDRASAAFIAAKELMFAPPETTRAVRKARDALVQAQRRAAETSQQAPVSPP